MSHPDLESMREDVLAFGAELGETDPPAMCRSLLRGLGPALSAPFHVVACGEFSRGKSNLLNALVERPGLFPTHVSVTTSVVTEMYWGEEETATIVFTDGTEKRVSIDGLAEYVTEQRNERNRKGVRTVRLTAPLEMLRQGLALVDTPGIGSLNVEHAAATYAYLAKADAVLFVASADERMGTTELDYLAEAMERCPNVITVITKIDKLVEPGPAGEVEAARERVAARSDRPPQDVLVVGVSARRKLRALRLGDGDLLHRSGFPALEELLWNRLAVTLGAERLNSALDALDGVVTALAAPVTNGLTALSSETTLEDVLRRLEEHRANADRLAMQTAAWRRDLLVAFRAGATPARDRLVARTREIDKELRERAARREVLDQPEQFVRDGVTALVDVGERAGAELRAAAEHAARQVTRDNRLTLAVDARLPGVQVLVDLPEEMFLPRREGGTTWYQAVIDGAAKGGAVGTAVGVFLGATLLATVPVAAAVGGVVGNVVGLFAGLRGHLEWVRRERHAERHRTLTETVLPDLRRSAEEIVKDFDRSVDLTAEALVTSFDERITAARESLAASIDELEELRASTERDRDRRHEELLAAQRRVRNFRDRLAALRERVRALEAED